MPDPTIELLAQRLARLERQHRLFKLGALIILAVVAAALALGAATRAKTVEAEGFVLRDAQGKVRAELLTDPVFGPRLRLREANGKVRLELALKGTTGPYLSLRDANGNDRATLDAFAGNPGLALFDSNAKSRMEIILSDIGVPSLWLYDQEHQRRAALAETPDNALTLDLRDAAGRERVILAVPPAGPFLRLQDETGKAVWSAP